MLSYQILYLGEERESPVPGLPPPSFLRSLGVSSPVPRPRLSPPTWPGYEARKREAPGVQGREKAGNKAKVFTCN